VFDRSISAPPQTPLGNLQRSPGPVAGFKGPTSRGRKDGKEWQQGRVEERKRKGERRKAEGGGLRHGCWGMDAPGYDSF